MDVYYKYIKIHTHTHTGFCRLLRMSLTKEQCSKALGVK